MRDKLRPKFYKPNRIINIVFDSESLPPTQITEHGFNLDLCHIKVNIKSNGHSKLELLILVKLQGMYCTLL